MRCSMKSSSAMPLTASTTRPSTSVEKPYCQVLPGW